MESNKSNFSPLTHFRNVTRTFSSSIRSFAELLLMARYSGKLTDEELTAAVNLNLKSTVKIKN
jgi:hypothetical protein